MNSFIRALSGLTLGCSLCLAFVGCDNSDRAYENASVVNVEKGAAPEMWTPETEGVSQADVLDQAAGLTVHPIDESTDTPDSAAEFTDRQDTE